MKDVSLHGNVAQVDEFGMTRMSDSNMVVQMCREVLR